MPGALAATLLALFALPGAGEQELDALLRVHAERASAGDADGSLRALAELEQKREALKIRNLPLASTFLLREAEIARGADDTRYAKALAESASRLSPDLPASHALRFRIDLDHPDGPRSTPPPTISRRASPPGRR